MSDCANVEMRELLPDLLHGSLDAPLRAHVEAHVATCADCAAELELLRLTRAAVQARPLPRVDVGAIVAALPRPQRASRVIPRAARPLWRIAAAVTFVALGGISLTMVRQYFGGPPIGGDTVVAVTSPVETTSTGRTADSPGVRARIIQLTAGGGVSDLADEDLEALIGALEGLEAVPYAEPDTNRFARLVAGTTGGN